MTIPPKKEKVETELHRVLGEGQGVGLITGIVFCLHIDGDITKKASKSGGGGGMCQSTLNWVYKL